MTGLDIKKLREAMELEAFAFARILGVHVSTLYRWEQSADAVTMDPLQREILEQLAAKFRSRRAAEKKELGQKVLAGLLAGGALMGLSFLLGYVTGQIVLGDRVQPEKQKGEANEA